MYNGKIGGIRIPKPLARMITSAISPRMPKARPSGRILANGWNITLFCVVFDFPFSFSSPQFCLHPETKPHKQFRCCLMHRTSIPDYCILKQIKLQQCSRFPIFTPKTGMNRHFQARLATIKTTNYSPWVVPSRHTTNPRWRTAAILKNRKTAISHQRFDRCHKSWYENTYWLSESHQQLKIIIPKNPRWRTVAVWYHLNCCISAMVLPSRAFKNRHVTLFKIHKSFEQANKDISNYISVIRQQISMVKSDQFTTKCKVDKVIALKWQISLWYDFA